MRIADSHTNVVLVEKNGEILRTAGTDEEGSQAGGKTSLSAWKESWILP